MDARRSPNAVSQRRHYRDKYDEAMCLGLPPHVKRSELHSPPVWGPESVQGAQLKADTSLCDL